DFHEAGRVGKAETSFRDGGLRPRTVYFYQVQALGAGGRASRPSLTARTQPRAVEDVVVSVISPREARLTWPAPPGGDLVGYHVERAPVEVFSEDQIVRLKKDTPPLAEPSVGAVRAIGAFVRLTEKPVREAAFTDSTLDLTRPAAVEGKPLHVR